MAACPVASNAAPPSSPVRPRASARRRARGRLAALPVLSVLAALAALPVWAQYKVVGPDGRITYTDRPPAAGTGRVSAVNTQPVASGAGSDAPLPIELRQPVSRYPVTLYTIAGACEPCNAARQLLRERGVPYAEKQVATAEDTEALQRLTGARDAPTLAIGTQIMRGLAPEVWRSYLDAAGYPRESRLPAGYSYAAPTPLVERREAAASARPVAAATPGSGEPSPRAATAAPTGPASGIRF